MRKLIGTRHESLRDGSAPSESSARAITQPRELFSLCSADGNDVDSVDLFCFVLQTRLDAAYE